MARLSKEAIAKAEERVKADPRGAPITVTADEIADPIPEVAHAPAKAQGPRCVLDDMPVNSVLVILQYPGEPAEPWLQTPAGKVDVPHDDPCRKLPVEAEIKRTAPHVFVARQRGSIDGRKDLVCATAIAAVQQFKKHFHDERD